jgi:pimeloyl-ACP methyl ester carboxylesterase
MVWAPLGLEPFPRDVACVGLLTLLFYNVINVALVVALTMWLLASLALFVWYVGTHEMHSYALRSCHLDAWKPSAIVYVVGLGEPFFMGAWCDWLFGGRVAPFIRVPPPTVCSPLCDLGDDPYLETVAHAIAGLSDAQRERVALVGLSRGAGVALRYIHHYPLSVACVVLLNGPFRKAHDVLRHRLGHTLGDALWAVTRRYTRPHDLTPLASPTSVALPPLFFVTATGDAALPPEAVRSWATHYKAPLLELTSGTVGHTLYFGAYADKAKVQDWVVEQMNKR